MSINENLLYGVDLRTSDQGELIIDSSGDLAIVGGLDNLHAAIRRMLNTEHGSWFEESKYGANMNKYLSMPNTETMRRACGLEAKGSISLDPRIAEIPLIKTIKFDDTRFDIEITITPIGVDSTFNFIYPINIGGI